MTPRPFQAGDAVVVDYPGHPLHGAKSTVRLSRRFTEHFAPNPAAVRPLDAAHHAVVGGHTIFSRRVVDPSVSGIVLVSGIHQRKIGGKVVKGAWAGLPVYTLTLEERATCPRTCHHWRTCMGNAMPWPERHRHGPALEAALHIELAYLARRHLGGFVVRLHILGDFYSVGYAERWGFWLAKHRELRVFGYSAWPRQSSIGLAVGRLNAAFPQRCFIRYSVSVPSGAGGEATTLWREASGVVPEGIVCPAQTGATAACGTCALCWATPARDKTIVFIGHGMKGSTRRARVGVPPNPLLIGRRRGRQPMTPDAYRAKHAAIIDAYARGWGAPQIAKQRGVGVGTIYAVLKRAGIARAWQRLPPPQVSAQDKPSPGAANTGALL